jgi:hypothetical protein
MVSGGRTVATGAKTASVLARARAACHDPAVDAHQRLSRPALGLAAAALLMTGLLGCSKKPPSEVADRLWVSEMPSGPRDRIDAFVLTEVGKRSVGSFYHGSLYRGVHDSFTWTTKSKDRGVIRILQDQRDHEVTIETCTPDRGFDHCIMMKGDPKKVVRYQSRKRWSIPRRGQSLDVPALMVELADDDQELEAALGQ